MNEDCRQKEMLSLQYIENLSLDYIARRLVDKEDWDLSDANETVAKYKKFLMLICLFPDIVLVPTIEIDEAWHAHILHTKQYMDDCQKIFGTYRHHAPSSGEKQEAEHLEKAYKITRGLYEKVFNEPYEYALNFSRMIEGTEENYENEIESIYKTVCL